MSGWLNRDELAGHIGVRVDQLPRLQRAGKLPCPSYHLGPKSPRWQRDQVDALFTGHTAAKTVDQITQEAVQGILQDARRKRQNSRLNVHRLTGK